MLHFSDRAMLRELLGLFFLSTLCSAMLLPNTTKLESTEEDSSTSDPNTHWLGPDVGRFLNSSDNREPLLPVSRNRPLSQLDNPWLPFDNFSQPDSTRSFGVPDPTIPPVSDTAICDLLLNAPEPPPFDQIPFFCICSRCKGTPGPKGDHGDRGPPGAPGSPGIRGLTGLKGQLGFTGPPGMKGQKGDLGEKGESGAQGFTGTKGERGFKGEKGDQGLIGPPGSQGAQGETGSCPASCETIQGPPGVQGTPGPAGARGLPGVEGPVGTKGLKGDKGDQGRPGDPGLSGLKGDRGEQGLCKCTDGVNGTDGRAGEKGAKGEKGDTGAQGVQGPVGPKGIQGITGPIGVPGPCSSGIQSAFSASVRQSFPLEDQPIPFPSVFTNQQAHFNPDIGIYTAPINGTYIFSFHLAVASRPLKAGLFRNLFPVVRVTEVNSGAIASQTVVLHLITGDQVWLQVKNSVTNGIYTDSESSSTFSGYLLHPDSCDFPLSRDFEPPKVYDKGDYSWDGPVGTTAAPSVQEPVSHTVPH